MITKLAFLILALAVMACNALTPSPQPTFTPEPTATVTVTPSPTATPVPLRPFIAGALWVFKYGDRIPDLTGVFPYTHGPADVTNLAVTIFLDLPDGWPEHPTELHVRWYQDGTLMQGWEGSVLCYSSGSCKEITASRFSSSGFSPGRYEARLYLDDGLLDGRQAAIRLIPEEWVGDLRLLKCDSGTADTCNTNGRQLEKFPDQLTIPAGSRILYVSNAFANLPSGSEWRVELYQADRLLDFVTQTITERGNPWSGRRTTIELSNQGAAFEPGTYTLKLVWKGNVVETFSFEVQPINGQTT